MGMVKRFDVYLCTTRTLTRPCVVVSPDEMNQALPYAIGAPITTLERVFPCRLGIRLKGKQGQVALDLIRTISQAALTAKIGTLPESSRVELMEMAKQMFFP